MSNNQSIQTGYRIVESQGGRQSGEYPVITAVTDNAYESELALAFKVFDKDYWLIRPGNIARAAANNYTGMDYAQAPSEASAREWVQFIAALYVRAVQS